MINENTEKQVTSLKCLHIFLQWNIEDSLSKKFYGDRKILDNFITTISFININILIAILTERQVRKVFQERKQRWFDRMEEFVMKKPALIVYTSGTTGQPKVGSFFL